MEIFRCFNPEKIKCFHVHISKQCPEMNFNCAFYVTTQVHVPTDQYRALEFEVKEFYMPITTC